MALYDDPKKKKPEYSAGLLPGAQLVPGTMAAKVADAVTGFKANYQASQDRTGAYMREQAAIARPTPTSAPVMAASLPKPATPKPVIASPGASATQARMSPGSVSTQSPASTPTGAGASTAAGGAAPLRPADPNTFTGSNGITKPVPTSTIGSVTTQNFGNPVVPQAPGSIARPGVASTFGLGVNDPRLQAPPIARPGQLTLNPNGNAETFNARQDREASKALASDLGTEAFMLRGKTDPASLRALAEVAQTRAGLLSGTEGLSAAAIQGTANRGNQFGIADLNNAGENNRAGIQADVARGAQQVTREGQQLDYGAKLADIARPQLKQDINGNFINIAGGSSTNVVDANGQPVRGQVQANDTGQITPALQLAAINNELKSLASNPPMTDDPAYTQRVQTLRSQQEALLAGGGQGASAPPPGAIEMLKKDPALAAQFDQKYGQGAAARYAK